jgi:hypothetical protein
MGRGTFCAGCCPVPSGSAGSDRPSLFLAGMNGMNVNGKTDDRGRQSAASLIWNRSRSRRPSDVPLGGNVSGVRNLGPVSLKSGQANRLFHLDLSKYEEMYELGLHRLKPVLPKAGIFAGRNKSADAQNGLSCFRGRVESGGNPNRSRRVSTQQAESLRHIVHRNLCASFGGYRNPVCGERRVCHHSYQFWKEPAPRSDRLLDSWRIECSMCVLSGRGRRAGRFRRTWRGRA